MTDMQKTRLFRWAIFFTIFPMTLIAVAIFDVLFTEAWRHFINAESPQKYPIEVLVFTFVLTRRLLGWLDRRVWIGTHHPTDA